MEYYIEIIKKRLSLKRYEHSLGVAETASELAIINGADPQKAYLTGVLHDYAKEMDDSQLLAMAKDYNIPLNEVEIAQPQLLHGIVGACLVKTELGIDDGEILDAIRYHTTGCSNMTMLTKIIYIADYIEPNRDFPGVELLRKVSYENLDKGVLDGLNHSIRYILDKNLPIHNLSIEARNQLISGSY
ncbi:MAG: bis(5'-nucleosyl)-tetraphosphatase (symmetrical) YqeK [Bacillota bacterium]